MKFGHFFPEENTRYPYGLWAGLAAVLFMIGALLFTMGLTWWPWTLRWGAIHWPVVVIFFLSFLALGGALVAGLRLPYTPAGDDSKTLYGRYMVGVGYALSLCVLVDVVAFAGFAYTGRLDDFFAATPGAETDGTRLGTHLMFSLFLTLSGALFYIANSLRTKRDSDEAFDATRFWGGLWYRLGEAVLFTIVLFLVSKSQGWGEETFFLPAIATLLGMFVKSGERLIFGMAHRIFAAVSAMVPMAAEDFWGEPAEVPGRVRNLQGAVEEEEIKLHWKAPTGSRPEFTLYRVEQHVTEGEWRLLDLVGTTHITAAQPESEPPWTFRVAAHNRAGRGPWVQVEIPPLRNGG